MAMLLCMWILERLWIILSPPANTIDYNPGICKDGGSAEYTSLKAFPQEQGFNCGFARQTQIQEPWAEHTQ